MCCLADALSLLSPAFTRRGRLACPPSHPRAPLPNDTPRRARRQWAGARGSGERWGRWAPFILRRHPVCSPHSGTARAGAGVRRRRRVPDGPAIQGGHAGRGRVVSTPARVRRPSRFSRRSGLPGIPVIPCTSPGLAPSSSSWNWSAARRANARSLSRSDHSVGPNACRYALG